MLHSGFRTIAVSLLAALLLAPGCGEDDSPAPMESGPQEEEAVADFALVDVNPASATHGEAVSPRQYLEQISAWYFGHAT